MEQNIQKCLVAYFKYVSKHNLLKQTVNEQCTSILNGILVKCRNLELLKKVESSKREDNNLLKKPLMYSILLEINDFVCTLKKLVSELEDSSKQLRNKFNEFDESIKDYSFSENSILVTGCSTQPSLSRLLEHANDSWIFFEEHIGEIQITLQLTNFTKESEVNKMLELFKEDCNCNMIDNILTLSQFCEQTNINPT